MIFDTNAYKLDHEWPNSDYISMPSDVAFFRTEVPITPAY